MGHFTTPPGASIEDRDRSGEEVFAEEVGDRNMFAGRMSRCAMSVE